MQLPTRPIKDLDGVADQRIDLRASPDLSSLLAQRPCLH